MKSACFLDRDGVLNVPITKNGKPYPPSSLDEFKIFPKTFNAIELLHKEGFLCIVVTNQPDVGRGWQKKEIVEAMHAKLLKELKIDDIFVCFDENSHFYKPNPGMLLEAARKHSINLNTSYMIGDRWRDIGAAKAAGCVSILIDYHYRESLKEKPDITCSNLQEAVEMVLFNKRKMANARKIQN